MAKAHLGGYKSPKTFQGVEQTLAVASEHTENNQSNQQELNKVTSPNINRYILGDIRKESQNTSSSTDVDVINNIPPVGDHLQGIKIPSTNPDYNSGRRRSDKVDVKKSNFRASQQFLQKKTWKKRFKARHQKINQKQQQQQVNKADMENIQNIKNQIKPHNKQQQQQHSLKNLKQTFNKKVLHRSAPFAIRSKFFLPDKRPRKEIIIPPTKFLLGGNISDPLNLNSLQDEALNATPTPTPKQSPITTPPKVEVIIPPNIHDPLHLLDPVDSIEYEKLLVSPMKRKSKSKSKHRNRKKKPKKRKHLDNSVSLESVSSSIADGSTGSSAVNGSTTATTSIVNITSTTCADAVFGSSSGSGSAACASASGGNVSSNEALTSLLFDKRRNSLVVVSGEIQLSNDQKNNLDNSNNNNNGNSSIFCTVSDASQNSSCSGGGKNIQKGNQDSAQKLNAANTLMGRRNTTDREKVTKDLRLDLVTANELQHQQQNLQHAAGSGVCGRKRKVSEGPNSVKNKFRRLDSMDKIVSPVIPQPGAWKRPPRTVPSGARKVSRVRSTSVSETELISPTDEIKTIESDSVRGDTPDVESHLRSDEVNHENQIPIFETKPKFRPEGVKYQYGNYNRYPGYRYLSEFMDVRLQVFKRNAILFRGKDVLDIGCNVGHITIAVAKDLAPKSILGIDIDKDLIHRARKNLSMYVRIPRETEEGHTKRRESCKNKDEKSIVEDSNDKKDNNTSTNRKETNPSTQKIQNSASSTSTNAVKSKKIHYRRKASHKLRIGEEERVNFFPISFPLCLGSIPNIGGNKDGATPASTSPVVVASRINFKNEFPQNVFFRTQNYVLPDEALLINDTQQYDLILCLSVTKWIHLNFGDAGLKLVFKRIFNQLRPGGKLILEAQNWASYKKKKNLTETIYNNYRNIEFFPNKFHEYLLSNEVGFSHSYTLGVPRHLNKGFSRPIQLYAKGDFTPSHIRWSDTYYPQTPYEAYRGIYASIPRPPYHPWSCETPHGNSGSYSCRQTPMHQPTSQYYNPLETDSYLPSYDTEVLNRHYVFASPLYQTVWSPPASLRNSSSHTPVFGSVRDCDLEDGVCTTSRHVYPPTEECSSPHVSSGAFNSIRETDSEECSQEDQQRRRHVYASCEVSSSPKADAFQSCSPDTLMRSHHDLTEADNFDTGGPGDDSSGGGRAHFDTES